MAASQQQREVGLAIAMLIEAFGVHEITPARVKVYERALLKLPPALLVPMVERAIETRRPKSKDWLPSVQELREDAEYCRQRILGAQKYEGCAECENSPGWRERLDRARTVERCPCWKRYQERLAALGVGQKALSSGEGDGEVDP